MFRTTWIAAPLVLVSGFCALIYQVVWTRELRLVFGASTAASSAVIAIFIAGLGFGGLWFGRRVERSADPLGYYARLEFAIALLSALTLWLLQAVRALYVLSGGSLTLGIAGSTLVRVLLAALVLGPPTWLMGGTLPAIARAVEDDADVARRGVAIVYGVNTLGAVLGCTLSTFLLLERLGSRATLYVASGLNVLIALVALGLSRRAVARIAPASAESAPQRESGEVLAARAFSGEPPALRESGDSVAPRVASDAPVDSPEPTVASPAHTPGVDAPRRAPDEVSAPPSLVFISAALVGFAFFLMELVWYRMLGPLLGGTVFTFGLILAVALAGIGIGSALYAVFFAGRRARLAAFALTCGLEGACIALPFALGDRIAVWTVLLRPLGALGFHGLVFSWLVIALIVVFPAALVSGVQFPMLIALLGRGRTRVALDIGSAYAANTLGAIAGALAGGFGAMPAIGALGCWRMVGGLLAGWGAAVALYSVVRCGARWRSAGAFAFSAATLALLMTEGPTAAWRHSPIGAGRVAPESLNDANAIEGFLVERRRGIEWETDGIESTVALNHSDGIGFLVNGKSDGNARIDAATQVMGGLLGAALVPRVRNALVIGMGTGSTAGWLGQLPEIEQVHVAEIEPAILAVAARCAPVNERALENPKLGVFRGDARELLAVSSERYDLIISEPSNPYRSGVSSLYTREFYADVLKRLAPHGLFVQWVQAYDVDPSTLRSVFATLGSVFPYVETWHGMKHDLLLVGSLERPVHDVEALRARLASQPFDRALRSAWMTEGLEGFLSHCVANVAFTRAAVQSGAALNTDDLSLVEFGFARGLRSDARFTTDTLFTSARARGESRPELRGGSVDWPRVDYESEAFAMVIGVSIDSERLEPHYRERMSVLNKWKAGDFANALMLWKYIGIRAGGQMQPTTIERMALAEIVAYAGDNSTESWISSLIADQPTTAIAMHAVWLTQHERRTEGLEMIVHALEQYRSDPWPLPGPMARALSLLQTVTPDELALVPHWLDALAQPFAVYVNEPARERQRLALAFALGSSHPACLSLMSEMEPHIPWTEPLLDFRAACYAAHRHPLSPAAAEDLERFRAEAPIPYGLLLPK